MRSIVFDKLEEQGRKIYIWHAVNDESEFDMIHDKYGQEGWIPVQGGPTIMLRSLRLFSILGYYVFEVFGFDSCVWPKKDEEGNETFDHHAYDQEAADGDQVIKVALNGKDFYITGQFMSQVMEFQNMVKAMGQNWKMRVHGDGLINHLITTGAN